MTSTTTKKKDFSTKRKIGSNITDILQRINQQNQPIQRTETQTGKLDDERLEDIKRQIEFCKKMKELKERIAKKQPTTLKLDGEATLEDYYFLCEELKIGTANMDTLVEVLPQKTTNYMSKYVAKIQSMYKKEPPEEPLDYGPLYHADPKTIKIVSYDKKTHESTMKIKFDLDFSYYTSDPEEFEEMLKNDLIENMFHTFPEGKEIVRHFKIKEAKEGSIMLMVAIGIGAALVVGIGAFGLWLRNRDMTPQKELVPDDDDDRSFIMVSDPEKPCPECGAFHARNERHVVQSLVNEDEESEAKLEELTYSLPQPEVTVNIKRDRGYTTDSSITCPLDVSLTMTVNKDSVSEIITDIPTRDLRYMKQLRKKKKNTLV